MQFFRVTAKTQENILTILILSFVYVLAFAIRLFSYANFGNVLHENDSFFNFRATSKLVEEGLFNFHDWFDVGTWYPLGRDISATTHPALMWTTASIYHVLHYLDLTMDIKNVCAFVAPFFASNTAIVTYFFAKEVDGRKATGFFAAAIVAIIPGYLARTVAGSFDNEVIAIFALMLTFYTWVKAVKTGSLLWSIICSICYFYLTAAWGGYVLAINLIPLHVLVLLVMGRFSHRIYIAYSTFYLMGSVLAMQIPLIGFKHVSSVEHMLAMITFFILQVNVLFSSQQATLLPIIIGALISLVFVGQYTGFITPLEGRFYALLDPTYTKQSPLLDSKNELPTAWSNYFFDLNFVVMLFPAGIFFCIKQLTDSNIFLIIFGVVSAYFSGVVYRLMVVLAPVAAVLAAIALQRTISDYMRYYKPKPKRVVPKNLTEFDKQQEIAQIIIVSIFCVLVIFTWHSTWVAATQYSSPSIVLGARGYDGEKIIFDDFREGYSWLRANTAPEAKILSWWDYGYQISAIANRTTIIDNNGANTTHIAQVGLAFISDEDSAIKILQKLDVDYVVVIFGGYAGYDSDDINKLIWMIRVASGSFPGVVENDYYTSRGDFSVGSQGSRKLLNSLMYKLSYFKFGKLHTTQDQATGFDRVRGIEIGNKDFELKHFEEAYTSLHWLVRIYKVKKSANRF